MKVISCKKFGNSDVLKVTERPKPEPAGPLMASGIALYLDHLQGLEANDPSPSPLPSTPQPAGT